jgi:hypothetical protein
MNAGRPGGDRREHDFRCRNREVRPVMFADAEEGEADLIGELALRDDIADRLRL